MQHIRAESGRIEVQLGSILDRFVNTNSTEMDPFSVSREWNEWINSHSK